MSNDSIRHEFGQALALVQEQMRDLSTLQQERTKMVGRATAAEGLVEVTVNAQRMVVKTVIDESYFDEHEFNELGEHITRAAQAAVRQMDKRSAEMLAPMNERRKQVSEIAGTVIGVPGFREALAEVRAMTETTPPKREPNDDGGDEGSSFPTIRS